MTRDIVITLVYAGKLEMKEQTVITQLEREVLMMGDYVGVCWNGRYVKKSLPSLPMHRSTIREWQRASSKPYIDFVWLREDPDGDPYEDEDSPVAGGIDVDVARQTANELIKAAEYIEALEGDNEHT